MSVTKISIKFTEKKKIFNNYIDKPEIFDCGDFNIIKLFQYALFREQGFNARPYWKLPYFLLNIIFFIKRAKFKNKKNIGKNEKVNILIGDVNREIESIDGTIKSKYFENIISRLDKENLLHLNIIQTASKIQVNVLIKDIYDYFSILPLTKDDKDLLDDLKKTYCRILNEYRLDKEKRKIFSEVVEIFWREYRTYRELLKFFPNIKIAFLFPHYQRESLIYALKRKNVKIIELQHGLIAEEDMFYIYDKKILPIRHKALFADEMWVYGEYWKNVLLKGYEYDESQIKIFGYYLYYEKEFPEQFKEFAEKLKNRFQYIVFATAQKNLEHHLAEYLNFLADDCAKRNISIAIVVKPHPSATQDIKTFINPSFQNIFVVNYPMEWLFQICHVHLSIYSTTLFDALMFDVKHNYALKQPLFSDYVEGIAKQGVAQELMPSENVIEKIKNSENTFAQKKLLPSYFYAKPDYDLLHKAVQSVLNS